VSEGTDPQPSNGGEIASRTTIQVVDSGPDGVFNTADDAVVDQETGPSFAQIGTGPLYETAAVLLTDATAPDPGNGVLDIRDGQMLRVVYADETSGVPDPGKRRIGTVIVDCRAAISLGAAGSLFGLDAAASINGGCERDARGLFTYGHPDRYMDAGERIDYRAVLTYSGNVDLEDATASLRAVYTDADSPRSCMPRTRDCADPDRTNNPSVPSSVLTVPDSPKSIGRLPAGAWTTLDFAVLVGDPIAGTPEIEMLLGISSKTSGKSVEGLAVSRHTMNVDETSFLYSTDFPTGGYQLLDWNNNETIENPTTDTRIPTRTTASRA
jgi:hypothetical protein